MQQPHELQMRSSDLESNFSVTSSLVITLAKNNIASEIEVPRKKVDFQPSIFMCYVSFR